MGDIRKRKIPVIILSIIIIIIYTFLSAGVFAVILTTGDPVGPFLLLYIEGLNYFGFGISQFLSLLIIPGTIIILLSLKKVELEKSFLISRILISISTIIVLLNLFLLNLVYALWLTTEGFSVEITGTFSALTLAYFLEFILTFMVCLLMTIKID